jgi:predicted pyridoxine 5'-phosphate oxidase superfamily flavin-nucleotide-binding protein
MGHDFANIAFTANVRAEQARRGSRGAYARLDDAGAARTALGVREAGFIAAQDGFFQATVSQTGWPYVQFRGGPPGFLQVLDGHTLAYADLRGNRQYVSVGNLQGDDRVALILLDHAHQQRLKIMGRARLVDARDDAALLARLAPAGVRTPVERAVVIDVLAWDWNCPQHITPRFTEAQVQAAVAPLHEEIVRLKAQLETQATQAAAR